MTEYDYLTLVVPTALAAIISFVIMGINRFSKTSEGALTG